jgi:hypothetical protein
LSIRVLCGVPRKARAGIPQGQSVCPEPVSPRRACVGQRDTPPITARTTHTCPRLVSPERGALTMTDDDIVARYVLGDDCVDALLVSTSRRRTRRFVALPPTPNVGAERTTGQAYAKFAHKALGCAGRGAAPFVLALARGRECPFEPQRLDPLVGRLRFVGKRAHCRLDDAVHRGIALLRAFSVGVGSCGIYLIQASALSKRQ